MMKKLLITLLAFMLSAALCSCSLEEYLPPIYETQKPAETLNPYLEVVPDKLTYSEGYTPVESRYSYNALPLDGEKAMYDELLKVCYDISPEKDEELERYPMPQVQTKGYSLTEAQVRTAVKALIDDRPEVFWMTGTLGYYSDENTTIIQVYSNFSPEEVDKRVNAIRAEANAFYKTVPDGLSAEERELMVHDYLIDRVSYDTEVDTITLKNNRPDIYTVYGALVDQVAVCEGYSRAFQMLMNGLGVDCVGVMGKSHDQYHIWNAVKLDDRWYNTDVTWDDREEPYARYIYYNVNDAYLLDDHALSPLFSELSDEEINGETGEFSASVMNIFVPECSDSDSGYYFLKSPHLSDWDGDEVKSGLLAAAEQQDDFFVFYVDETLDYDETVASLFVSYPQYFFTYVSTVNDYLPDYSIDSSNANYFTHDKSRIVAVELHYY